MSMSCGGHKATSEIRELKLPWPSGYELRLSLERSRVLILVKVIGGIKATSGKVVRQ